MKTTFLLSMIFLLALVISCGSDDENITEPKTSANIIGSVNLYDESTNQIDKSGMSVRIDGSELNVSAITDTDGEFILENVPFGKYDLVYEKSGYGTYKIFDLEHTNTGSSTVIEQTPSLGQVSGTSITNLTVNIIDNLVKIGATTDPVANNLNKKYIKYFFSSEPEVSSENYVNVLETFLVQITPYNLNLNDQSFDALGYQSGETVYVKCYGESFWGNHYFDPELKRDMFPNLNPNSAPAVSFIVP